MSPDPDFGGYFPDEDAIAKGKEEQRKFAEERREQAAKEAEENRVENLPMPATERGEGGLTDGSESGLGSTGMTESASNAGDRTNEEINAAAEEDQAAKEEAAAKENKAAADRKSDSDSKASKK